MIANNAADSETLYGRYASPLDHMENCVDEEPSVRYAISLNASPSHPLASNGTFAMCALFFLS